MLKLVLVLLFNLEFSLGLSILNFWVTMGSRCKESVEFLFLLFTCMKFLILWLDKGCWMSLFVFSSEPLRFGGIGYWTYIGGLISSFNLIVWFGSLLIFTSLCTSFIGKLTKLFIGSTPIDPAGAPLFVCLLLQRCCMKTFIKCLGLVVI